MPAKRPCSTPSVHNETGSGDRNQEGFEDNRQDSHRTSVAGQLNEDGERMETVSLDYRGVGSRTCDTAETQSTKNSTTVFVENEWVSPGGGIPQKPGNPEVGRLYSNRDR